MNVFILQIKPGCNRQLTEQCLRVLSPNEKLKFQKFYFDKDKLLYLHSHAMLRRLLAAYSALKPEDLVFTHNAYGKPAMNHPKPLSFNLSHAHQMAVLAISSDPQIDLGADIEYTQGREDIIDLADHYFSPSESQLLREQFRTQQCTTFFQLWTLKEAYIKAIGKGLSMALDSFSFGALTTDITIQHNQEAEKRHDWHFAQTSLFDSYQMAIAVRNSGGRIAQPRIQTFAYQSERDCTPMTLKYVTSSQINSNI